jgi:hypothetical protein
MKKPNLSRVIIPEVALDCCFLASVVGRFVLCDFSGTTITTFSLSSISLSNSGSGSNPDILRLLTMLPVELASLMRGFWRVLDLLLAAFFAMVVRISIRREFEILKRVDRTFGSFGGRALTQKAHVVIFGP